MNFQELRICSNRGITRKESRTDCMSLFCWRMIHTAMDGEFQTPLGEDKFGLGQGTFSAGESLGFAGTIPPARSRRSGLKRSRGRLREVWQQRISHLVWFRGLKQHDYRLSHAYRFGSVKQSVATICVVKTRAQVFYFKCLARLSNRRK